MTISHDLIDKALLRHLISQGIILHHRQLRPGSRYFTGEEAGTNTPGDHGCPQTTAGGATLEHVTRHLAKLNRHPRAVTPQALGFITLRIAHPEHPQAAPLIHQLNHRSGDAHAHANFRANRHQIKQIGQHFGHKRVPPMATVITHQLTQEAGAHGKFQWFVIYNNLGHSKTPVETKRQSDIPIKKQLFLLLFSATALINTAWSIEASLLTPDPLLLQQRSDFNAARQAIKDNRSAELKRLKSRLETYPLYPYLEYWYLNRHLTSVAPEQIEHFTNQHGADTSLARRLHYRWLTAIAKAGQWQKLLSNYRPGTDVALQCHYRRALYQSGDQATAFKGIETLWLVGKSQPKACDPLFKAWQETPQFTPAMAWQRVELAIQRGEIYLTRYLERFLTPEQRAKAQLWREVYRSPEKMTQHAVLQQDTLWSRTVLLQGIKRLARRQPLKAARQWETLASNYAFNGEQIVSAEKQIALHLASQGEPEAMPWLISLADDSDAKVREWRVLMAIKMNDWEETLFWLDNLYPAEQNKGRWRYWRAQALQHLGQVEQATVIYSALARTRSYYGFLAADQLDQPYQFEDRPLSYSTDELNEVAALPGIKRAREFYALGDTLNARREWRTATQPLNQEQNQKAAKLAQAWGWNDRAIATLGDTDYRDDLTLRFPLAHQDEVVQHADLFNVDPSWAYAVIRQESAFVSDARSPRGALGLMQIMPSTGKLIARDLNTTLTHQHQLLDTRTNIRFGINYLRKVMARFDQNMVLATAAYNAGSSRVKKWLPDDTIQAADQWIELIPFRETRSYLKHVLAYTIIYDQRLNKPPIRLKQRMPKIKQLQTTADKAG